MALYDTVLLGTGAVTIIDTSGVVPQPRPVAILKDISAEISGTSKSLRDGNKQFDIETATTSRKVTLKAKLGSIYATALQAFLPGATSTSGGVAYYSETPVILASITSTKTANYVQDLGVLDPNGKIMICDGTSAPTVTGHYSVTAAGVYGFLAADVSTWATKKVTLMYSWTDSTLTTTTVSQGNIGVQTPVQIVNFQTYTSMSGVAQSGSWKFYYGKVMKLTLSPKAEDFAEYDVEIECAPDPTTQKVCDIVTK